MAKQKKVKKGKKGKLVTRVPSTWYKPIKAELRKAGIRGVDPRHVEAWIRVGGVRMDDLSKAAFCREVKMCARFVQAGGEEVSEHLARIYCL